MKENPNILIVMPAYNAAKTLTDVVAHIPPQFRNNVVLVDDASQDNTVEISRLIGLETIVHDANKGYGGNQKTCYKLCLERKADIVVMLHPDGQYDPEFLPQIIKPLIDGKCNAVFGTRMKFWQQAINGGMPWWKFVTNVFLTRVANVFLGTHLTDWHCGYRAYDTKLLTIIPFQEFVDGYDFDVQMSLGFIENRAIILELPIKSRYFGDASSINFLDSIKYGVKFLSHIIKFKIYKSNA